MNRILGSNYDLCQRADVSKTTMSNPITFVVLDVASVDPVSCWGE